MNHPEPLLSHTNPTPPSAPRPPPKTNLGGTRASVRARRGCVWDSRALRRRAGSGAVTALRGSREGDGVVLRFKAQNWGNWGQLRCLYAWAKHVQ